MFVLGGGSFLEHRALQEGAAKAAAAGPGGSSLGGSSVLYGATEMLSPSELVAQLAELGRKASARGQ